MTIYFELDSSTGAMTVMVNIHAREDARDNYSVGIFVRATAMGIHHVLHARASAIIIAFIQSAKGNVAAR